MQPTSTVQSKNSLSDNVYNWLVGEINSGRLAPGSRVPSERDLAKHFSVSRPVIREALSQLRSDGLVSVKRGLGVYVDEPGNHKSFKLDDPGLWSKEELQWVFELLLTVEVAATRYAAMRRTEEDMKEIRRCMLGLDYAIASNLPTAEHDFEFHLAIFKASQNPHLVRLNQHIENSVRRFIRRAAANTADRHPDRIPDVRSEHAAILKAIEDRDPQAAETAASEHLYQVAIRLGLDMQWLEENSR